MSLDLHPDTVSDCRQRGGAAAEDRPEAITEALETDQLGYGDGEPLIGDSYQDYPSKADLSNPDSGDFLRRLLGHNKVSSLSDVVAELTAGRDSGHLSDWLATLETATEVHGLDVDTLTAKGSADEGRDGSRLSIILGYEPPSDVIDVDNSILIGELYTAGLSVEEIASLLSEHAEGDVREGSVSDSLKKVGLLEGRTRDQQREAFEEKGGRIGGTTFENSGESGGLTIDANDF